MTRESTSPTFSENNSRYAYPLSTQQHAAYRALRLPQASLPGSECILTVFMIRTSMHIQRKREEGHLRLIAAILTRMQPTGADGRVLQSAVTGGTDGGGPPKRMAAHQERLAGVPQDSGLAEELQHNDCFIPDSVGESLSGVPSPPRGTTDPAISLAIYSVSTLTSIVDFNS